MPMCYDKCLVNRSIVFHSIKVSLNLIFNLMQINSIKSKQKVTLESPLNHPRIALVSNLAKVIEFIIFICGAFVLHQLLLLVQSYCHFYLFEP